MFQSGKREGFHVVTWSNGERYEGSYVNGEEHGTWTLIWAEAGDDNVVREVGPFERGERHGTWTGYDASGNVVGTIRFENGDALAAPGALLKRVPPRPLRCSSSRPQRLDRLQSVCGDAGASTARSIGIRLEEDSMGVMGVT